MNGKQMLEYARRGLGGIAVEDVRFFYDCLNLAATNFVRETKALRGETAIATVESQWLYDLPWDFLECCDKDDRRRYFMRYEDGTNTHRPLLLTPEKVTGRYEYAPDAAETPSYFAVAPADTVAATLTGTATGTGPATGGACTLVDSGADFSAVFPGDDVSNGTDGSDGVVLRQVDGITLSIALFGGTDNDVSVGDEYWITPNPRRQVLLNAPSATAGHVMRIPYLRKPEPVYHERGVWTLGEQSCRAIAYEAAYLFASDFDFDPDRDMHLHNHYLEEVRRKKVELATNVVQGSVYGGYRYR